MNDKETQGTAPGASPALSPVGLLTCVVTDLAPIKSQLEALSAKYRDGGEDRIGWEILQAIRVLDGATGLAELYLRGTPLPTLEEMRGILKAG